MKGVNGLKNVKVVNGLKNVKVGKKVEIELGLLMIMDELVKELRISRTKFINDAIKKHIDNLKKEEEKNE